METRHFNIHSSKPVLIRNKINDWKLLKYKKCDWCKLFKNKILSFRQGDKNYRQTPYWEQLCTPTDMTLDIFFRLSIQDQCTWHYFDYKYMKDILPEQTKVFNEINWNDLKLSDVTTKDTTLWIGNEGAHTPCHMDTYGCNFVAQILGRKLWILIPPEETDNLSPIRVPYEESSIYSSYNFYTPNSDLLKIKKAYKIILSPGEVLFVPRHWWHYVENLEVAISINVWVPMDGDNESRLEEALVRYYISNICKDLPEEEAKQLLNPNEQELLTKPCSFTLIQKCVDNLGTLKPKNKIETEYLKDCKELPLELLNIEWYIKEKGQLLNYDANSSKRLAASETSLDESESRLSFVKKLINSYCNPKNVNIMKESLLSQFVSSNGDKIESPSNSCQRFMKPGTSSRNMEMKMLVKNRMRKRKKTKCESDGRETEEHEIEEERYKRKRKRKTRVKK